MLSLKLSTALSYSNKSFKLPSSQLVYVLCGNTAQTGFDPGDRQHRVVGARQPRQETPSLYVPVRPHHVQEHTSESPHRSQESPTARNVAYRRYSAEVGSASRRW